MEINIGELARFEDIRIKMYPMDTQKHKEPHFHIILTFLYFYSNFSFFIFTLGKETLFSFLGFIVELNFLPPTLDKLDLNLLDADLAVVLILYAEVVLDFFGFKLLIFGKKVFVSISPSPTDQISSIVILLSPYKSLRVFAKETSS